MPYRVVIAISLFTPYAVISSERESDSDTLATVAKGSEMGGLMKQPQDCVVAVIYHRNIVADHTPHYHHPHHPHHPHSPHGHSPSSGRRLEASYVSHNHAPHNRAPGAVVGSEEVAERSVVETAVAQKYAAEKAWEKMAAEIAADGKTAAEKATAEKAVEQASVVKAAATQTSVGAGKPTVNMSASRRRLQIDSSTTASQWNTYPQDAHECYDRWVFAFTSSASNSAGEPLSATRQRLTSSGWVEIDAATLSDDTHVVLSDPLNRPARTCQFMHSTGSQAS